MGRGLLFADADSEIGEDMVARAIAAARREGVEHVFLAPGHPRLSALGEAGLLAFHNRVVGCGWGAFNLITRDAYRAIGEHEQLRLEILDDWMLGRLVRNAGLRTRGYLGASDLRSHWAESPRQLIADLEKNGFAALRFHTPAAIAVALVRIAAYLGAPWGALACVCFGSLAGTCAALAPLAHALPCAILAHKQGWRRWPALLVPLGHAILIAAFVNSIVQTLRRGGVLWRDTFYPLAVLRQRRVPQPSTDPVQDRK